MTLLNAKRRFEERGWEVTRSVSPYRYKARPIGPADWVHHWCLDAMLLATVSSSPSDAKVSLL